MKRLAILLLCVSASAMTNARSVHAAGYGCKACNKLDGDGVASCGLAAETSKEEAFQSALQVCNSAHQREGWGEGECTAAVANCIYQPNAHPGVKCYIKETIRNGTAYELSNVCN